MLHQQLIGSCVQITKKYMDPHINKKTQTRKERVTTAFKITENGTGDLIATYHIGRVKDFANFYSTKEGIIPIDFPLYSFNPRTLTQWGVELRKALSKEGLFITPVRVIGIEGKPEISFQEEFLLQYLHPDTGEMFYFDIMFDNPE